VAQFPDLFIFNSLTRKREKFEPLKPPHVGLYICGITPYDHCHIGHARCYVVFDVIRRTLERFGYRVMHIQNFTDVDDKIIARAKERGEDPSALASRYIEDYFRWMRQLNVRDAHQYPRVTEHIPDIIALIQRLMKAALAYAVNGDVYYKVRTFRSYGQLSGKSIEELRPGARVEVGTLKTDPLDFALWKKSKDDSEIAWDSPWGRGRPGWHIECSAMSMKYLGEDFDIHCGGQDLMFPHHENEIAQSCGATKKGFARVWLHNGFVNIDKQKMSKSLGNFFTVEEVLKQFDAIELRYFLLSQHYRSPIDFSDGELKVARTSWGRISAVLQLSHDLDRQLSGGQGSYSSKDVDDKKSLFYEALADDFNTPQALSHLHELATYFNVLQTKKILTPEAVRHIRATLQEMTETLGLESAQDAAWLTDELRSIADRREKARQVKDWKAADVLRQELREKGVLIEDTTYGWRLKKIH